MGGGLGGGMGGPPQQPTNIDLKNTDVWYRMDKFFDQQKKEKAK
jgi:hypothetical protein